MKYKLELELIFGTTLKTRFEIESNFGIEIKT
jgi:hypothetical protein